MTQPKFAPIEAADEVRPSYELATAPPWFAHRPGEFKPRSLSGRKGFGTPGPDQGYGLRLAHHFADKLVLEPGEHEDDVLCAAVVIGLRRAAQFGRAPVRSDFELALELFGYLSPTSPTLLEKRRQLIDGVAHDYRAQRMLATSIPASTLALSLDTLRENRSNLDVLIGTQHRTKE